MDLAGRGQAHLPGPSHFVGIFGSQGGLPGGLLLPPAPLCGPRCEHLHPGAVNDFGFQVVVGMPR